MFELIAFCMMPNHLHVVFSPLENYDHFVRDEAELERIVKYVLGNPVKANLVNEQKNCQWTFCKYDF